MSIKTGVALTYLMTFHEAANVVAGQITSSSGPIPIANKDKCKALVPELQLIAGLFKSLEMRDSKLLIDEGLAIPFDALSSAAFLSELVRHGS